MSHGARHASVLLLALLLAACRSGSDVAPPTPEPGAWGDAADGLQTRLTCSEPVWTLGTPLRVRVELRNVADAPREYDDQQADVNDPFEVTALKSGRPVPWIGGSVQTMGGPKPLAPGATTVLVDGFDLAAVYLLAEPGVYRVRYRALSGFAPQPVPTSNEVWVRALPGPVPPLTALAARVWDRLPPHWRLGLHGQPGDASIDCWYVPPSHLKRDVVSLTLVLAAAPPEPRASRGSTPPVDLGKHPLGHAYLYADAAAAAAWPEHRAALAAALAGE